MEVGHLERVEKPNQPVVFYGEVLLGTVIGEIYLIPRRGVKRSENTPDYEIKLRRTGTPDWTKGGAAWIKKFEDGTGTFFSLSFDDAERYAAGLKALGASAFPDDEQPKDTPKDRPVSYTIKWGRPRGGQGVAPEAMPVDDEIPF